MKTILYISDTYITSQKQLRLLLQSSLTPDMPIYEEILTLFLDGILTCWLNEGDDDEKHLSEMISLIEKDKSNSEIMSDLIAIFTKSNIHITKPNIDRYLCLRRVICNLGQKQIDISKDTHLTIASKYNNNASISFFFSVDKIDNESFELEIIDNNLYSLSKINIDVKLLNIGDVKEISFPLTLTEGKEHDIDLKSGENIIYRTHISVNPGLEIKVKGVTFKMKYIEGGNFVMGATREQRSFFYDNETPAHNVTMNDFYLGEVPVTQDLWCAVMGTNPSSNKKEKNPVEKVSWEQCQYFIEKLSRITNRNFRLPTEEEWEYAARGGCESKGFMYSGSNEINEVAWYDGNSEQKSHEVAQKLPNELGLYDMSGNVYEWCQNSFESYDKEEKDTSRLIRRGGSFLDPSRKCRVSYRGTYSSGASNYCTGLRLALT